MIKNKIIISIKHRQFRDYPPNNHLHIPKDLYHFLIIYSLQFFIINFTIPYIFAYFIINHFYIFSAFAKGLRVNHCFIFLTYYRLVPGIYKGKYLYVGKLSILRNSYVQFRFFPF